MTAIVDVVSKKMSDKVMLIYFWDLRWLIMVIYLYYIGRSRGYTDTLTYTNRQTPGGRNSSADRRSVDLKMRDHDMILMLT